MSSADSITELQIKLTHLERHLAEQDTEIYRLCQKVDTLVQAVQAQKAKLDALADEEGGGEMPSDEKPPHY